MISIRAGLIHNILQGYLTKNQFKEIIFYSNFHEVIDDFNLLKQVIPILKDDIELNDEIDEEIYFKDKTGYIEKYLLEEVLDLKNPIKEKYNLDDIFNGENELINYNFPKINCEYEIVKSNNRYTEGDILESDLNAYIEYNREKNICINKIKNSIKLVKDRKVNLSDDIINLRMAPFNKKSYGHKNEEKVINKLNALGYKIEPCDNLFRVINNIKINGKPDGYITEGEYKDCYLEIKSKRIITESDKFQCYCYYGITEKKILLVQSVGGKLNFNLLDENKLKFNWEIILKKLIKSTSKLLYILSINNLYKYEILKSSINDPNTTKIEFK